MIDYKLSKEELIHIIIGYEPIYDIIDDVDLKKCGHYSKPAFSYGPDNTWYWNDNNNLEKFTFEVLLRVLNVIKGLEPKIIEIGELTTHPILPRYVSLNGSTLRLKGDEYYRDGGMWGVDYKFVDGKLLSDSYMDHINGVELIEVTREEYAKDNKHYLPNKY